MFYFFNPPLENLWAFKRLKVFVVVACRSNVKRLINDAFILVTAHKINNMSLEHRKVVSPEGWNRNRTETPDTQSELECSREVQTKVRQEVFGLQL